MSATSHDGDGACRSPGAQWAAGAPRRVLCIKLKHIGDVLLMTPVVSALRRAWPGCAVAALVPRGTEAMLAHNPDVAAVITLDRGAGIGDAWRALRTVRRFAPDLVLEMGQGDREAVFGWLSGARQRVGYAPGRSGGWRRGLLTRAVPWNGDQHMVETNLDLLRACGMAVTASQPVLVVPPESRDRMTARLASAGLVAHQPLVVVHPVSRWLFKAWPEAGCAAVLASLAGRRDIAVAVTSGPDAREVDAARRILTRVTEPVIDLVGQTSLFDLAAVLERAVLFLGVDSAPMHMAAALDVPVIALFGPSGERSWGPWGDGHRVLASPLPCRPCGRDGCLGSKRSYCLEALPAQAVVEAAEAALARIFAAKC